MGEKGEVRMYVMKRNIAISPISGSHRIIEIYVQTILDLIKWKTTSLCSIMEDYLFFFKVDDLIFFKNESVYSIVSQPKFFLGLDHLSKTYWIFFQTRKNAQEFCLESGY